MTSTMDQQSQDKTGNVPVGRNVNTSYDGLTNANTECNMTSYLSGTQGRHVVNVAEANRLVQRFQLDWNLQLPGDQQTPWKLASRWVSPTHVYLEHTPEMGAVLKALSTAKIEKATLPKVGGYTLKLLLTLEGGQSVLFKPEWNSKVDSRHCKSVSLHNHVGEMVTFHLSRILGFRKTPLAVGRTLNLRRDIIPVASPKLRHLINKTALSPCRTRLCSQDGRVKGAMIPWLPEKLTFGELEHPWGSICRAIWRHRYFYFKQGIHSAEDICREAQISEPFRNRPALFLDLVDAAIGQYLIQNTDRKLYIGQGKYADLMILIDNARSFVPSPRDYHEILAPLFDCCRVRESTYRRLQSFQNGTLSYVLDVLTQSDPVYPLMTSDHLQALDRRLHKVLAHIHLCICKHGRHNVLL